jgi:hypothetical protein
LLGQYADSYHDGGKSTMVGGVARKWATDGLGGELRVDRIISVYNAGAYGSIGKLGRLGNQANAKELADALPEPTKSYIKKILGKNGAMDILTSDLKSYF